MRKIVAIIAIFGTLLLGAIELQTASKKELMTIKGIGDKKADLIIEYRKTNTLTKPEDLKNIKGFGDVIVENVKNNIKVDNKKTDKEPKVEKKDAEKPSKKNNKEKENKKKSKES